MIGTVIGLILLCVILGVVWWAAQQLLALITLLGVAGIYVPMGVGNGYVR